MAQERKRISRIKDAAKHLLNLAKQKLSTEKRMIIPEIQNQLNGMILFHASEGEVEKVERLLKAGADVNAKDSDGYTALMLAAKNGYINVCRLVIEKGADVNRPRDRYKSTPLMHAAAEGQTRICMLLIEKGADIYAENKYKNNALSYAIKNDKKETVEFLTSVPFLQNLLGKENFRKFLSKVRECTS